MVKEIKLGGKHSNGSVTLVDDDDFTAFSSFNWVLSYNGYAIRYLTVDGKSISIALHREIAKTPKGLEVDHINGNRLDNTKSNLRNTTHAENLRNQRRTKINTTSKYKGVSWISEKKKWRVEIKKNYKSKHLGYFDNEHDAARMYNFWATDLFGEYAHLNVIKEDIAI